jgi:Tfp pilus assembly protein PilF
MLLALAIYLMTTFKVQSPTSNPSTALRAGFQLPTSNPSARLRAGLQILLIALLSGIIAHFIEIQLGIAVVATRTCFWVYAALTVVIGFYLQGETTLEHERMPQASDKHPRRRRGGSTQGASLVSYSLLVGFVLATMAYSLVGSQVNSQGQRLALLGFFGAVWLIGSTTAIIEAGEGIASLADSIKRAPLLISLGWFVAFLVVHIFVMQGDGSSILIFYYFYLFLTIMVIAVVLFKAMPTPIRFQPGIPWLPYPLLVVSVVALIIVTNLNPMVADIHYKRGLTYANSGQWDASISLFQQALNLAPDQDFYHLFLAGAWVEKAETVSDITQRSAWLEQAQRALERGREISPFNPDHVSKLGLLYRVWGEMLTEQQEKTKKFNQALEYYRQAVALRPYDPRILNEWGLVHFAKGEYDQAVDKYQRSLNVSRASIQTYSLLGDAYRASGDFAQAVEAYETMIEIAPDDFTGHRSLALLYEQMGYIEEAVTEAEIARRLAPGYEALALEEFILHLQAQRQ